jgi:hypothetical protein
MDEATRARTFKTEWFAKAAKRADISDTELCKAIVQVRRGQCNDLGGGVYKKRLNKNMYRSLIIAKGGKHWICAYLFAKKDRENIDNKELQGFRELAGAFESKTDQEIEIAVNGRVLVEICNGEEV